MRKGMRIAAMTLLCAGMLVALSGCDIPSLALNPQELYALPELPAKYTELSRLLSEILSSGAEYAPPASGMNIQSVQLIDLDSDGREEAVAFFRNSGDEKPLKIYIFTSEGDTYHLSGQIEGSGISIYSVAYNDLDHDGRMEIAVSWRATAELQVLEIYSPALPGQNRPRALVRTDYVRYVITDLTGDGRLELVVLRAGEDGESIADYYSWQDGRGLISRSPAKVSATMAELSQQGRVYAGTLRGGAAAIFVTGVTDQLMAVTDILTLRGGELFNIALSEATGVSGVIVPFYSLYPTDINGDDVTETPCPRLLPPNWPEEETDFLIEWCSYDHWGQAVVALSTYHNLEDAWYLRIPEAWKDLICVSRTAAAGESAVTFHIRGDTLAASTPFLRICALTGSGREVRAVRGARFILSRQSETMTIYTAEFLEGNAGWEYAMTEEEVRAAFNVILREWLSGNS